MQKGNENSIHEYMQIYLMILLGLIFFFITQRFFEDNETDKHLIQDNEISDDFNEGKSQEYKDQKGINKREIDSSNLWD